jgi:acyl-CoA thioesterase
MPACDAEGTRLYFVREHDAHSTNQCILGYMSDMNFIGTVPTTLGLERMSRGPKALGMLVCSLESSATQRADCAISRHWITPSISMSRLLTFYYICC